MELNDTIVIPATPDRVFAALNDPEILRAVFQAARRWIAPRRTASTRSSCCG
jgi:uncharacterized protein YndB with AHSA1/START domain